MVMVRKARCPACGSARSTPTESAFIYCDYCGHLMDLDLERYRAQVPVPGDEYRALEESMTPRLEAARAKRDRGALMALYRVLKDRWVTDMGALYTPRVKDPEFRARFIEYLAYQAVVGDLSERLAASAERLSEANAGFEMEERGGRYLVRAASLWPIIDAQREAAEIYLEELRTFPGAVADPDDTPPAVSGQLGRWMYVAGFMTMVDDDTAQELLRRTGLTAAYERVPDPELHQVFCGHCGARHQRPAGARRILCERCGRHAEVGTGASCHACAAPVTIGLGQHEATCGHCAATVRLAPRLT